MSAAAVPLTGGKWRLVVWQHPEWWAILVSACTWIYLMVSGIAGAGEGNHIHGGAYLTNPNANFVEGLGAVGLHWSVMIAAMMVPPLAGQLRVVAARSLWCRRNRAMVLFLGGYASLWLAYGLAAEAGLKLGKRSAPGAMTRLVCVCFVVAALWQVTAQKRKSLVGCHFTIPMAPYGWRADFDCCRYGIQTAVSCCTSCWALMLACAATGHALWAIAVVTIVFWSERFLRRPRQLWFCAALIVVALTEIVK